jgi:hypothetical protein
LPVDEVARLVAAGHAQPLLPGPMPVPVLIEQRWWHRPSSIGPGLYEPAPPSVAALFARQHARFTTTGTDDADHAAGAVGAASTGDLAPRASGPGP